MDSQPIASVSVVGLGKMGNAVARNLAKGGFRVRGFDIDANARATAAAGGVVAGSSPADVARDTDLIIVLTAFEHQVEDVLFGVNGIVGAAPPGAIIAIAATISPSMMKDMARRIEAAGLVPLDTPLCRPEHAAEAGQLLITGGGDLQAFERCRPAFSTFATDIFHLGPAGCGETGKMVNNLILWSCLVANHEGLALGEKFGVDREAMREMLLKSSGDNWALRERINFLPMPWPWAEKDMMIVLHEADNMRLSVPLCGTVKEVVKGIKIARNDFSGALAQPDH